MPTDFVSWLLSLGPPGVILAGIVHGDLRLAREVESVIASNKQLAEERDMWRAMAIDLLKTANHAVSILPAVATVTGGQT